MVIERKRPVDETMEKRSRYLLCNGFEKLHNVFIKYENNVAIKNAIPFANGGIGNMKLMKVVATITCTTVASSPDTAKRKACFEKIWACLLLLLLT